MWKLKFATVREDPMVEESVIRTLNKKNVLMISSGGCSALSLQSMFSDIDLTIFDSNNEQIELSKIKLENLKNFTDESYPLFNIGVDNPMGLNGCGEFESLFRSFRYFIYEFVLDDRNVRSIFTKERGQAEKLVLELMNNPYWTVVFDSYFSNPMLVAMFGREAIQHAAPHSYPSYFRHALEKGLKRDDFQSNYFLQHIFLGFYTSEKSSWPYYLSHPNTKNGFQCINDVLTNIDIGQYDLISLSNIFDWMSEVEWVNHIHYIRNNACTGATILFRQLNNGKDYELEKYGFFHHAELEGDSLKKDRSLFYNKINIATKR
jgi:S-adenosylmethionine-diacylglycerol 3-amino-3-carboxypropyl transferase